MMGPSTIFRRDLVHLIIGGTGALGSATAVRLLDSGAAVRVLTRDATRAAPLRDAGAEIVVGNLLDPGSIERACDGATTVLAAAHSLFGRGRTASANVDGAAHRRLIDTARSSGVHRFVYTSVYDFEGAFSHVPFFRIKREVEDYLKASGLAYTILRPTIFMESHVHGMIGQPVLTKGKVTLFGRGERARNFIAADDVARIAVLALTDPALDRRTIEIGGSEHHTNCDVVRLYEEASGRSAKVTRLPLPFLRALSTVTRPIHPGISQVVQTAIIADTVDQRYRGPSIEEGFGVPATRLDEWVAARVAEAPASTTR